MRITFEFTRKCSLRNVLADNVRVGVTTSSLAPWPDQAKLAHAIWTLHPVKQQRVKTMRRNPNLIPLPGFRPIVHATLAMLAVLIIGLSNATGAEAGCETMDPDEARFERDSRGRIHMTVTGMKPYINMRAKLIPRPHGHIPKYWQFVIEGCYPGYIFLPVTAPFNLSMDISNYLGTRGVELVGPNRRLRYRVNGPRY